MSSDEQLEDFDTSSSPLFEQELVSPKGDILPYIGVLLYIIEQILLFFNSPAFETIVNTIQQIVQWIIGLFSLISLLGYHGVQSKIVDQYISSTSFFVATTHDASDLFNNRIHLAILLINLFTKQDDAPKKEIDWKKIILQILLWIIQRLLDDQNNKNGNGNNPKASNANSFVAVIVKALSIIVCLRYLLT